MNLVEEVYDLVQMNAKEIAEKMFSPKGFWFYFQEDADAPNGIKWSSMLTLSTRLNPANFEIDEWVFAIQCNDDLDDVPVGEEVELYYNMIMNDWTEEDIGRLISFPAGRKER